MGRQHHVKVFKKGRDQAVWIPREFELPSEDAVMRKDGDRLIIEPAPPKSLLAVLATLQPLEEDFPEIGDNSPGSHLILLGGVNTKAAWPTPSVLRSLCADARS